MVVIMESGSCVRVACQLSLAKKSISIIQTLRESLLYLPYFQFLGIARSVVSIAVVVGTLYVC